MAKPADAVRGAVAALNRGDVDGYAGFFAPDCQRWLPGIGPVGAAVVVESLRELQAAFDGFRLDERLLLESGHHVVARWGAMGRHTGIYQGLPATGTEVDVETCEIYEIGGDQITASWSYGDPMALLAQLGRAGSGG